ncbi:asparagine synthetase A [Sphaerisporangium corydalis]|uniref:Asparagine synthetase A n=1 Tax=Sphaerisporangium corydalis TaxID=1441875 RepID=A0ABV9ECC2_9ACTN|nr:asparagine synthetase A [Sphaerisporangium corydalis]
MTTERSGGDQGEARPPGPLREHLTSATTRAALRVRQGIMAAAREYLTARDFAELQAPIIGPVTDPGVRGAKQVDIDYYGQRYKLMSSAILYKQASLLTFDRIFCLAPNIRLEPPETASTGRHLVEFHQIDVEVAGASREDAMELAQALVQHVIRTVITTMAAELEALGRDTGAFTETLAGPFDRITHAEATEGLAALGHGQSRDSEITWAGERVLSLKASRPFLVVDYPKGSRGFYDRESRTRPGVLRNFDLIAPEGYGELCSGSERESEYATLVTRMRETGENPAKYGWYLDLAREGIRPSAGFGLGLERLTRYVTGLAHVWQTTAYPKLAGVISP